MQLDIPSSTSESCIITNSNDNVLKINKKQHNLITSQLPDNEMIITSKEQTSDLGRVD